MIGTRMDVVVRAVAKPRETRWLGAAQRKQAEYERTVRDEIELALETTHRLTTRPRLAAAPAFAARTRDSARG